MGLRNESIALPITCSSVNVVKYWLLAESEQVVELGLFVPGFRREWSELNIGYFATHEFPTIFTLHENLIFVQNGKQYHS